MTSPHTAGRTESPVLDQQRARGVWTNGIGNKTASHLNFTRSLADKPKAKRRPPRWKREPGKQPYAGFDETDRGWKR